MIYRILINNIVIIDEENQTAEMYIPSCSWPRGGCQLAEWMHELGLKSPRKFNNKKAKFWFTEAGWNHIGKELMKRCNGRGWPVKVIKRKNPKRSDVAWSDPYQVALLPNRKKR